MPPLIEAVAEDVPSGLVAVTDCEFPTEALPPDEDVLSCGPMRIQGGRMSSARAGIARGASMNAMSSRRIEEPPVVEPVSIRDLMLQIDHKLSVMMWMIVFTFFMVTLTWVMG